MWLYMYLYTCNCTWLLVHVYIYITTCTCTLASTCFVNIFKCSSSVYSNTILILFHYLGSLASSDLFFEAYSSKGLNREALCPCAGSPETLTVSLRRYIPEREGERGREREGRRKRGGWDKKTRERLNFTFTAAEYIDVYINMYTHYMSCMYCTMYFDLYTVYSWMYLFQTIS